MSRRIQPVCVFTANVLRAICRLAVRHDVEVVGVVLGRKTGPVRWIVDGQRRIPTVTATKTAVRFRALDAMHPRRLGEWHSHPYPKAVVHCMAPQLNAYDKRSMNRGDLEIIVARFPVPDFRVPAKSFVIQRRVGSSLVRVEAWWKDETKRGVVRPCDVRVRR